MFITISSYDSSGATRNIQAIDDRLYVAGTDGFEIWDITTPDAPRRLAVRTEYVSHLETSG